jgi:hypothetical protein
MSESNTEILNKKPILKVLFELAMKRLEIAALGAFLVLYGSHNAHNEAQQAEKEALSGTNWVGKVTSDAHNEIWSNHDAFVAFTNETENRISALEKLLVKTNQ